MGGKVRKFDTKVQSTKYKVIKEVAKQEWEGTLRDNLLDIPELIMPGKQPTLRCCIYKERAILGERVKIAIGKNNNPSGNVIGVIDIACDECPVSGHEVTDLCRGCLAHRCERACRKDAIYFEGHSKAHIDKAKCVECGECAKVCPFSAIVNRKRPCEQACKVKAVKMSRETLGSEIDYSKCVSCGECVYQCPFGALVDESYILEVVGMLKERVMKNGPKVYAMVAPSIGGQFVYAKQEQVIAGIRALGFSDIVEAAYGADLVAWEESKELAEKGFLLSSCCPAFVEFVQKQFPDMAKHLSHNLSPMATLGKKIKEAEPDAKVVFIGPCTAKKMELKKEAVAPYIDSVITFQELQALFDSRDIEITELEGESLDKASYFGRIFAHSGGLTEAVGQGLREHGYDEFEYHPLTCDGLDACRKALLRVSKKADNINFIEGMACVGGCIGGAGCLTHADKNKIQVDKYAAEAQYKTIGSSVTADRD